MGYRPTIGYLGVSDMWYTIYPSEITHPCSWEIPPFNWGCGFFMVWWDILQRKLDDFLVRPKKWSTSEFLGIICPDKSIVTPEKIQKRLTLLLNVRIDFITWFYFSILGAWRLMSIFEARYWYPMVNGTWIASWAGNDRYHFGTTYVVISAGEQNVDKYNGLV